MADRKGKQTAGDIILTPLPGGYLIQRIGRKEDGSESAVTVGNDALLESAMKKARAAAAETADATIWLYDEKGSYRQISPEERN